MPTFWHMFSAPRPSSRSRTPGPREPFVVVTPNHPANDSRQRCYSNPSKPRMSHHASSLEAESIRIRTPVTSSAQSMKSGKSSHSKQHSVSFGSSTVSNSASSFNGYNYNPQILQKHDYRQSVNDSRGRSMSTASVRVHPLLAVSRHHRPSLLYDVVHAPSSRSVIDRDSRTEIPLDALSEPAVYPSFPTKIILRSDMFPWPVVAFPTQSKPQPRFYLASPKSLHASNPITILDILWALHNTLKMQVTKEEWASLEDGGRTQRKITKAYDERCQKMGGFEHGIRRLDWLGSRTKLAGIELARIDHDTGEFEFQLIFSRGL